jgi:hypothetical protein
MNFDNTFLRAPLVTEEMGLPLDNQNLQLTVEASVAEYSGRLLKGAVYSPAWRRCARPLMFKNYVRRILRPSLRLSVWVEPLYA